MDRFRKFLESDNPFEDMFADMKSRKIVRTEEKVVPFVLQLWRGFNGDLKNFEYDENHYLFKPNRSDQGMLWFTHPYIAIANPIQYAKDHGQWFLSYRLPCKKHIQTFHWDDGESHEGLPDYWRNLSEPTRNGRYYAGIELPEPWLFSYKMEKFVGYPGELRVPKSAVAPSDSVEP